MPIDTKEVIDKLNEKEFERLKFYRDTVNEPLPQPDLDNSAKVKELEESYSRVCRKADELEGKLAICEIRAQDLKEELKAEQAKRHALAKQYEDSGKFLDKYRAKALQQQTKMAAMQSVINDKCIEISRLKKDFDAEQAKRHEMGKKLEYYKAHLYQAYLQGADDWCERTDLAKAIFAAAKVYRDKIMKGEGNG